MSRCLSVLLLALATVAGAIDRPPTQHEVKTYLEGKVTATCAGQVTAAGHLANALRLSCRTHRAEPAHDWHTCADELAVAWCASH